jgi:hypothetical protein
VVECTQVGIASIRFCPSGSGLSGEPGCAITVDCSTLMWDLAQRLSAGESLEELTPDLHYGLLAEVDEFARELLARLQSTLEVDMSHESNRLSNSPEPATIHPSWNEEGFSFCGLGFLLC